MRKFTAIFLAVVMVCGLFGCNKNPSGEPALWDLLITQAASMSQMIGMSAEAGYLATMSGQTEVTSLAQVFTTAATGDPVSAKMVSVDEDFAEAILTLCGQIGGADALACSELLSFTTHMYLPKVPEQPVAMYLCYSEGCHFITVFTPLENNLVSVRTYPLFADVANTVLAAHFSDAQDWDASEVQECIRNATGVNVSADCTGKALHDKYYYDLVKTTMHKVKPLNMSQISEATTNEIIGQYVSALSQALSPHIRTVAVYRFPESVQTQIDHMLSQSSYSAQLRSLTEQQVYLSWPNTFANSYGEEWLSTNAILRSLLNTSMLGAAADADEAPALVLMDLGGGASALMTIYPNQFNAYLYSYTCLPIAFSAAKQMLTEAGAELFH